MTLIILSSDTAHHRYFFQELNKAHKIDAIFLETSHYEPDYNIESPFQEQEKCFESEMFFKDTPNFLPDCNAFSFPSINHKESLDMLKQVNPDVGIVFGTGKLSEDVINCFSFCLLNIHRGLPEYYRGLDSDLWAIYDDRYDLIGTAIHKVEPELDTGDILYQENIEILNGMKIHQLRYYTTVLAVKLAIKALDSIKQNKFKALPQRKKGKYLSFMPKKNKILVTEKFNSFCKKI